MTDEQVAVVVGLLTDIRDELRLLRMKDVQSDPIHALMVLHGRDAESLRVGARSLEMAREHNDMIDSYKPSTPDTVEAVAAAVAAALTAEAIHRRAERRSQDGKGQPQAR